jgi:hypothetical protein
VTLLYRFFCHCRVVSRKQSAEKNQTQILF